jgi:hypothetical protein
MCTLAAGSPAAAAGATRDAGPIIGVNDGSGWGAGDSARLHELGLYSERVEAGSHLTIGESVAEGWREDVVTVGNVADEESLYEVNVPAWTKTALAQVEQSAAYGVRLMEVGNEMYWKGPRCAGCGWHVEPRKYAAMFMSLARAVDGAHVPNVTLLFDSYGDFEEYEGAPRSQIWSGGGWIGEAVEAEPELRTAVGGFAAHPYGEPGENRENDGGPVATEVQHEQAVALGFRHTGFYATEVGVSVEGQADPSSLAEQAEKLGAISAELISFGFVKGIWYYQTHDDGTGKWGLIEQQTGQSPFVGRPSLHVVSEFALGIRGGQNGAEPAITIDGSGPSERFALGSSGIEYHPNLRLGRPPWSDGSYD